MSRLLPCAAALAAYVLLATSEARPPLPKERAPKAVTNSLGMKFVPVPKGQFTMGSTREEQDRAIDAYENAVGHKATVTHVAFLRAEGPRHEVNITRPFHLGAHEVTQGQFKAVMGCNPSHFSTGGSGKDGVTYTSYSRPAGGKDKVQGLTKAERDALPVENVSWEEAVEFCKKLSAMKKEKEAGRSYRLPTEAEWEYACRAGSSTTYHFGKALTTAQANFGSGIGEKGSLGRTAKVGSYKPNAWGLYDMHGNVFEWCADWYGEDYYKTSPKADPTGPEKGSYRVRRGGDWSALAGRCRSAYRSRGEPAERVNRDGFRVGFRVALVRSEKAE